MVMTTGLKMTVIDLVALHVHSSTLAVHQQSGHDHRPTFSSHCVLCQQAQGCEAVCQQPPLVVSSDRDAASSIARFTFPGRKKSRVER
jgi:hypothetical protein